MARTSSDFSVLITNRSITVNYDGNSSTVRVEDKNYQPLLDCIRENRWDDVESLLQPARALPVMSNGDMRVENGQILVKTEDGEFCAPSDLSETILFYIENKLPFQPLVNFAIRLNKNPSYRSVQQLFSFIKNNQFTITDEGKFIAYKSVDPDFKDVYSKTFDNSVGQVVKMPRNQVNENPNETCSNGLHVANYDYAHNIYRGEVTVFVEVDPKDVVSVPVDYNNAKMRVCEYKVLGISNGEIKKPIYSNEASCGEECDCDEEVCEDCNMPVDECDCDERCYNCDCVDCCCDGV